MLVLSVVNGNTGDCLVEVRLSSMVGDPFSCDSSKVVFVSLCFVISNA